MIRSCAFGRLGGEEAPCGPAWNGRVCIQRWAWIFRSYVADVSAIWAIALIAVLPVLAPAVAAGLTPTSPEVQSSRRPGHQVSWNRTPPRTTASAPWLWWASACSSTAASRDHPKILAAVSKIRRGVGQPRSGQARQSNFGGDNLYSTGLAIIFLVELDPVQYRADIECLLAYLRSRQKPHGGWGYPNQETGDTSMTQYGVLSSWEAMQAGFDVPMESIEGGDELALAHPRPQRRIRLSGEREQGRHLVKQSEVKPSMTAAGLGSLYICSTMLGIGRQDGKTPRRPAAGAEGDQAQGRQRRKGEVQVADRPQAGARGGGPRKRNGSSRTTRSTRRALRTTSSMPWSGA